METTLIPLSQLDSSNLARLAALHCAVMHTLLADLGTPVVLRYYTIAQANPAVISFCAVSAAGELDGWAIGSPVPADLTAGLIKSNPGWFAGQVLRLALTRPGALIDLLRSQLSASDANVLKPGQIELTYMGVASHAQGRGLGKLMLAAFSEKARQAGYTSVAITVETDNSASIGLHARAGFQITKTFTEGRYHRHRMEGSIIGNREA
jgi:ribosomal protein S18 acetylase RimI-like enzyme